MASINGFTRQLAQSDSERIEQSLRDRLLSTRGDRFMLPTYGTRIADKVGIFPTAELIAAITAEVTAALADEPDYDAQYINVFVAPDRTLEVHVIGDTEIRLTI